MLHILAAVAALVDPTGPVVEARIADVIASPERYAGKRLRIRGQIDACYADLCSICPEELTGTVEAHRRCLSVAFDDLQELSDQPAEAAYRPNAEQVFDDAFRFSVVTVEGGFWPPDAEVSSWSDRPPASLIGVRVQAVHRRIPSNDGVVTDRYINRLEPAQASIRAAVTAAYRPYDALFADRSPATVTVLTLSDDEAWACICRIDDCSGAWPKRTISVYAPTINDPYVCRLARRGEDSWRVFAG